MSHSHDSHSSVSAESSCTAPPATVVPKLTSSSFFPLPASGSGSGSDSESKNTLPFFQRLVRFVDESGTVQFGDARVNSESNELSVHILKGDPFGSYTIGERVSVSSVRFLAPIDPSAVYAVGMNYRKHAEEVGAQVPKYPVIFAKSTSSVCGPEDFIVIPRIAGLPHETEGQHHKSADNSAAEVEELLKVDYEVELAVVIGKTVKNIPESEVYSSGCILGYTVANDVTARYYQFPSAAINMSMAQWHRSKSFDSFCPLGPCIVSAAVLPHPDALTVTTYLNGVRKQHDTTADLIFSIPRLISFLSSGTTLHRGTVILTGTPSGIGYFHKPKPLFLRHGDQVSVQIEHIGKLTNIVTNEYANTKHSNNTH